MSPGFTYVQGYEVGYTTPFYVYGDNVFMVWYPSHQPNGWLHIPISRVVGIPDLVYHWTWNINSASKISYPTVNLVMDLWDRINSRMVAI